MGKKDYEIGSVPLEEFFWWMKERHEIWKMKSQGHPQPWTSDPIMQEWAFTNVFRQLDRGTLVIQDWPRTDPELLIWNIIWYRMFNWREHNRFFANPSQLDIWMRGRKARGAQIFTNAHMTSGISINGDKLEAFLSVMRLVWASRINIYQALGADPYLQTAWEILQTFSGIGGFIAYEIACDFRFLLDLDWQDTLVWCNIGPGCKRGLHRLGLPPTIRSCRDLWFKSVHMFPDQLFELREIEHSLCEFDKYQRVKTGAGTPRRRYVSK